MVEEEKPINVSKMFIFSQDPLDDEVFMAIFDWFKSSKPKYIVEDNLLPQYGSIMNPEEFPIDPLRAQSFAEVIWREQFDSDLELSIFYHELFDLDTYGKIIIFMEARE